MNPPGPRKTNVRQKLQAPYLAEDLVRYERKWRKHATSMEEERLPLSAIQYHPSVDCGLVRPK